MKKNAFILLGLLFSTSLLYPQSKISLGVTGGVSMPLATMSDLYQTGFGGALAGYYNIDKNLQLSVSVEYAGYKFNNDVFNDLYDYFGVTNKPTVDATLTDIPVLVGARYFFSESGFKPYASAKLGVHFLKLSAASITVNSQQMPFISDESATGFGWGIGLGFLAEVSNSVSIDVNAALNGNGDTFKKTFNYQKDANNYFNDESSSSGLCFGVMAGLVFQL